MKQQTLAVIPARGGSKRIPRKNLCEVGGKPLIAHTIKQAETADEIDQAIVSTDDDEIANVAGQYGGDVPFERPAKLATDTSTLSGTITHALQWASDEGYHFDQICALQVTSPLRKAKDIDGALSSLTNTVADSCLSISKYVTPPQWAVKPDENGFLQEYFEYGHLWSEQAGRSQDIPDLYHPNGAIFAATTDAWGTHESFYTPQSIGYKMPPQRSIDIDEPWELELVRSLLN